MLNCLCRTRGFPKALFIDLLVLVLHMVREIWRETDRIKAGKNFKVTESKFSNVTALNGLAKFCCIIVSADRTLQIYATICIFQIRNLSYTDETYITHVTFVRNTKSLEIWNMPLKSSELRQASWNSKFTLGRSPYLFYKSGVAPFGVPFLWRM